jgi:hypothetical protein
MTGPANRAARGAHQKQAGHTARFAGNVPPDMPDDQVTRRVHQR